MYATLDIAFFTAHLERTRNSSVRIILFVYNSLVENGLSIGKYQMFSYFPEQFVNSLQAAKSTTDIGSGRHISE